MFVILDVWYVGCAGCNMFEMRDVRYVGCYML